MARMSNMVMKPVSWVKKHWVKVLVAIVVIYAIYYFFIEEDDMEGYTTENVYSSYEIQKMKNAYENAKDVYEASLRAYNDPLATTYIDRDGNSTSSTCSKTVKSDGNSTSDVSLSKYTTASGCGGHLAAMKTAMETAWTAYEPYAPKQKRSKKARRASRVRRFFGLK